MKNMRRRKIVSSVALNVVIAVLAMLWLVPVFWLVVSSFRAEQGAYTSYLWPKSFTFGNYVRLFTDRKLFDFPDGSAIRCWSPGAAVPSPRFWC